MWRMVLLNASIGRLELCYYDDVTTLQRYIYVFKMKKVEIKESMRLSEHFSLGEVCKTSHKTKDGNVPSHVAIENLKNICENWLEDLRYSHSTLYGDGEEPIIITSGYRSPEVNKLAGGSPSSNHLTGCAVDIRPA